MTFSRRKCSAAPACSSVRWRRAAGGGGRYTPRLAADLGDNPMPDAGQRPDQILRTARPPALFFRSSPLQKQGHNHDKVHDQGGERSRRRQPDRSGPLSGDGNAEDSDRETYHQDTDVQHLGRGVSGLYLFHCQCAQGLHDRFALTHRPKGVAGIGGEVIDRGAGRFGDRHHHLGRAVGGGPAAIIRGVPRIRRGNDHRVGHLRSSIDNRIDDLAWGGWIPSRLSPL